MTKFPVQGGCHCGAVRYTLLVPAMSVQHCHCSRCRKLSGGLTVSGAVVARADIRIESTENLTAYRSSPSFARMFCKTCGCFLFSYEDSEPKLMYFAAGTLDGGVHPGHPAEKEAHVYVGSKAEWDRIGDDLPKYDASSPDEIITERQRSNK
jgi:hypothetical protein